MPVLAFSPKNQADEFFSDCPNISERPENDPAPCKTARATPDKRNPGELAGSTGAEAHEEKAPLAAKDTPEDAAHATAIWADQVLSEMDRLQRVALAWAALRSLDPDAAIATAESVIESAGAPLPPFLAPLDGARFWAGLANRQELKAYALASFEAMGGADRSAFLDHVVGRYAR